MNFLFTNFNMIALVVWLAFFCVVAVRTFKPSWIGNISYRWLIFIAISIHLLHGTFDTWRHYVAWSSNPISKILLSSPLSSDVPFPSYLEFLRPLFDGAHGYFVFYSFGHFFLSTIALLVVTGLFYLFLVARARYRSFNFREGDIMLIVLAMLISGWPGVIVLLPLGLISAVLLSLVARVVYGALRTPLPPAFLLAAPFALIFATPLLTALHLYPLLKL